MLEINTTKPSQKELIDKYLKDEINILKFIKEHNKKYIDFEYPLSFNKKIMDKIKKDIKKYSDNNIQLILKITNVEKSKYNEYEYEEFKINIIKNFENEKEYKLSFYKHLLEKEKMHWHGNTYYLLGIDEDGEKYYLQRGKFDCGWYWSGGYINTFNRKKSDISLHTHYKTGEVNGNKFSDITSQDSGFNKIFKLTTLTEDEKWTFHELMKTFYIMQDAMNLSHRGGANISSKKPLKEQIQNNDIYEYYKKVIAQLHKELDKLLSK
jgi:hypothetical protein